MAVQTDKRFARPWSTRRGDPLGDTLQLSRIDIENLPNYRRKTRAGEYSSGCPACGGKDRFLFWPDKGNYLCRRCELKGFVTDSSTLTFSPDQYDAWKRAEAERQQKERQQQLSTLDRIATSTRADVYHAQMADRSYWYEQGLTDETIDRFKLGYSPACPTYPDSPSWTIPIFYQGRLYNIRHRLARPNGSGKYRPEMAGLPAAIFNADVLTAGDWMVVLVEGEVKSMVLTQAGFCAVGIPGANSFKDKWLKLFKADSVVYVALDPGADSEAWGIATTLKAGGIEARVCTLPCKPDDFLTLYSGTPADLVKFLAMGRRA
jgi:hypothetical protein